MGLRLKKFRLGRISGHWFRIADTLASLFAAVSLLVLCYLFAYPLLFLCLLVAICLPVLCSFFGAALGFHNPLFACSSVFLCCFSAILLLFRWYWTTEKHRISLL